MGRDNEGNGKSRGEVGDGRIEKSRKRGRKENSVGC